MSKQAKLNAAVDPISRFLTRSAGLVAASHLLEAAQATNLPLSAMWIDMDRFRQVNDSFGHAGGDRVITRIAERIRLAAPADAEFLRVGGDEFVILIQSLGPLRIEEIARHMLFDIEQPIPIDGILIRPSASIGIAQSRSDDDAGSLLERADRAMIDAKRQGGNRFVVSWDDTAPGRHGIHLAREELEIESALHSALETGGLQLYYQPILRPDGSIEAVEALMRCPTQTPKIMPENFIPVAEKTGLIGRMGDWSLLQGTRCAARLRELGFATRVAINVSRLQLIEPDFLAALHGALVCADVSPELIELELTESLFMDISSMVQANLLGARAAGIGLAIDDFGTGFSSLSSLKDIPATKLKIDRAFIHPLPNDRRTLAIVKATAQLGRELGMVVVAEGVENQEQLVACEVAGFDATQGFVHARPMPESDLIAWMQMRNQK